MKKLLLLILSLVLCFSAFSACGEVKENQKKDDSVAKTENVKGTLDQSSPQTEESAPSDAGVEFKLGTVNGDVYENTMFNMGWILPSGWRFYSDSEIDALNGEVFSRIESESIKAFLESQSAWQVYDMFATDDGGNTVNVVIQKLNEQQMSTVTEESLHSELTIQANKTMFESAFGDSWNLITFDPVFVEVNGEKFYAYDMVFDVDGGRCYARQFMMIRGEYYIAITVCGVTAYGMERALDNFYLLS